MPKTISDETLRVVREKLNTLRVCFAYNSVNETLAAEVLAALDNDGRTRGEIVAETAIPQPLTPYEMANILGLPYSVSHDTRDKMRKYLAPLIDEACADAVAEDRKGRETR